MAVETKEPLENKLQCLRVNNPLLKEERWNSLILSQIQSDASLEKAETQRWEWFHDKYLHDHFPDRITFVKNLFDQGYYQYSQANAQRLVDDLQRHQHREIWPSSDKTNTDLMLAALNFLLKSAFCNNDAEAVLAAYDQLGDPKLFTGLRSYFFVDYTEVGFAYYFSNDIKKTLSYFRGINESDGSDDVSLEKKYNLAVAYAANNQIKDSNKILLDLLYTLRKSDKLSKIPDYIEKNPKILQYYKDQYCEWPSTLCESDKKTAQDIYKNVLDSSKELEKRAALYNFIFRHPLIPRPKKLDGTDFVIAPEIALARHSLLVKSEYLLAKNYERVGDQLASYKYYKVRELDPGFRTQEILDKIKKYESKSKSK